MKITYYKNAQGGYLAVTTEAPAGFSGVLYAGRGPEKPADITSIAEQCYEINQLKKLVPIPIQQVPAEWILALGYEQVPVAPKPRTPRAPRAPQRSTRKPLPPYMLNIKYPWEGDEHKSTRHWVYGIVAAILFVNWFIPAFTNTIWPTKTSGHVEYAHFYRNK